MSLKLDRETWIEVAPYLDEALELSQPEQETWIARLALEKPQVATTVRNLLANLAKMAQITAAEVLVARGRLPEARREIEAALNKLRGATSTHEALYLGGALLIASKIAAAQARYADAEEAATDALHLFEQRARSPELSADVGEALLTLAQDRRAQGDSDGARRFATRALKCLTAGLGADHAKTKEAAGML
jgi:tetratricopeptide (TPR) repeat protein